MWTEFNITGFKTDAKRWDEGWDKALDTLSLKEVYGTMGWLFRKGV
jgi:hypothetical protein